MTFYIYKGLKKGLVPVARITSTHDGVRVDSSEFQIQGVLAGALSRPATFSEWRGDELIKTQPSTREDQITASLKRFLSRPYFASRDVPKAFRPRYTQLVEVPS